MLYADFFLDLLELEVSLTSQIDLRSKSNLPAVEGLGRAVMLAITLHKVSVIIRRKKQ